MGLENKGTMSQMIKRLEEEDVHLQKAVSEANSLLSRGAHGFVASAKQRPVDVAPLDVIANEIRSMPYGDVVELAEGCKTDPNIIWAWAKNRV